MSSFLQKRNKTGKRIGAIALLGTVPLRADNDLTGFGCSLPSYRE
ncbi:protein of unknown function [Beijerinckiaceae bacterium RH AL1]|nr:protein of unknown function [Beijerinckiaceae bacterium RH AL8]VVB42138.1 protein of unknown function [Beijerinckiaceae bacterium RH CH11]VVC53156.1 protein of unknown function [Beijerinckiaceae bacterium RH AL1]